MTQDYQAGSPLERQHEIDYLWSRVDGLKLEDWPPGVHPTSRIHDLGTAGFPDGAGLYRKTGEDMPPFPVGGVMFVGHNTDAEGRHASRRTGGLSPGEPPRGRMPTWVRLYDIMDRACFDRQEFFLTNIYIGLIAGNNPRAKHPGASDPSFRAWCDAFLDEQIRLMSPRAIVTLGGEAAGRFGWRAHEITGVRQRAGVDFIAAALMHPSSGHLYKKKKGTSELWIDHEARILKQIASAAGPHQA